MKQRKSMENLEKLEKKLRQFPKNNAVFYAEKLGWSRSKIYEYLGSLNQKEKVFSENGLWFLKNEVKPSAKEKPSTEYDNYLKELKEIGDISYLSSDLAWSKFCYFQTRLPPELKEKISQRVLAIAEDHRYNDSVGLKIAIDNVCTVLYEYYKNPQKVSQ